MAITITVGTNSWITQDEADSYFDEKWGASAWASLSDNEKAQLIITAYRWINQQSNLSIPAASSSQIVKNAQMEAAWFICCYWTEYEKRRALNASGVSTFRVSSFSESLNNVKFPDFILNMLIDFIANGGQYFPRIQRDLSDGKY